MITTVMLPTHTTSGHWDCNQVACCRCVPTVRFASRVAESNAPFLAPAVLGSRSIEHLRCAEHVYVWSNLALCAAQSMCTYGTRCVISICSSHVGTTAHAATPQRMRRGDKNGDNNPVQGACNEHAPGPIPRPSSRTRVGRIQRYCAWQVHWHWGKFRWSWASSLGWRTLSNTLRRCGSSPSVGNCDVAWPVDPLDTAPRLIPSDPVLSHCQRPATSFTWLQPPNACSPKYERDVAVTVSSACPSCVRRCAYVTSLCG